ncbi:NADH:ubiquinone reductase (Na(+)-transporting) subunit F [uncultured Paracoccus sp.]|uniref:NADH:ubiquinone reductase (Na(+)-transporting) subunit F n=1 Tax=uncultured Paracoccus sp. TaxID=189685 RepID=UPI002636ADED|nr:NADH:ubiquinone reductase (Na(+)-transporting) subunit F [uncultured Paracoccus sp.]
MTEILLASSVIVLLLMGLTLGLVLARQRLIPQEAALVIVNDTTEIEAGRGDKLLTVLHGAGIGIPAACGGSGTCGLCRVTAEGPGVGQPQATERGILSAAERRAHVRLACQVTLRGAATVTVGGDVLDAASFACRVESNRQLAPLIRELVLAVPDGREIDFRAGGFMQLSAPPYRLDFASIDIDPAYEQEWQIAGWPPIRAVSAERVTRAYSVANRPQDAGRLVFNIRLAVPPAGREGEVPPGVVSSWLFARSRGDSVDVSGPFGDFFVQPTGREMVLIGGGVGMAPLRAMIHDEAARGAARKMTFFYGARSRIDLFYVEEFAALAAKRPAFRFVPALSDPAPGDRWTGETGFIHETVRAHLARHPAPEDCEYYLCGPPVMISAVIGVLESLGVEQGNIFNDDFGV